MSPAPQRPSATWGSAVVLGGSLAGLAAARVLADFFEKVTVVDKDVLPEEPGERKGVPQAHHFHALLSRGREIFEDLYPGFTDALMARGAPLVCGTSTSKQLARYGPMPRYESNVMTLFSSRGTLEWFVRQATRAFPGIELVEGTSAEGLVATDDKKVVTGALVARGKDATPTTLAADLVVDATGRTSAAPSWLERLGWAAPPETTVNAHWGYASRFVEADDSLVETVPVGHRPLGTAGGDGPTRTRGGFVLPQDSGRWIITVYGCAKDYPPTDEEGFQAFADSLGLPDIGVIARGAKPLTPIRQSRTTTNRLRSYEQLTGRPEAFVCIGDAVSSLNPAYGQGMTVAGLGALDLRAELEQQRDLEADGPLIGLAERFQARLAQTNQFPWGVSAGGDYRVDGVKGDPAPEGIAERAAFSDRLEALSSEDLELNLKLNETFQMVRSPAWIEQDTELRERILADWERLGHMVKAVDLGYR